MGEESGNEASQTKSLSTTCGKKCMGDKGRAPNVASLVAVPKCCHRTKALDAG